MTIERDGHVFRDEGDQEAWDLYGGDEDDQDYGGAFDGFQVVSDADPGL